MNESKLDRIFSRIEAANKVREATEHNSTVDVSGDSPRHLNVWLAGYKSLGEDSAKVIFGSTEEITPAQVIAAVPSVTDGKMTAYAPSFTPIEANSKIGSARVHYASIFAVKPRVHFQKATNDVLANYKMISSTEYLDVNLQKVWERKDINGEPYLVRVNEMNPEEILRTSLMAKTDSSFQVNSDSFVLSKDAEAGDYVEFFALAESDDGNGEVCPFMDVAEVTANYGDALDVVIKDGTFESKATIPAHAVRSVAKVTAGASVNRQQVMDYLYKAFGERYKDIILKTGAFDVDSKGKAR